jgi:cell shape-determining protein MreD
MDSKRSLLLVMVLLLSAATSVWAQTFRGTVLGTVTDTSGAVIAGATVKIHNVDTGLETRHTD